MRRVRPLLATAALAVALGVVACQSGNGSVTVVDVRIGQPTGPNAALYLTAASYGQEDRLIGATTDVARAVQLHESTVGDDGNSGMRPVEAHVLPEEGDLVLEPGGPHLMLVEVQRLEVGDVVEVELIWEHAGETTVEALVVDPGDTLEHDG